ncbi:TetR/AcrR family transcriptional regulator [Williamsia sterculiae]|uniref:Transcriptional regulator, TetR family n=1 Tax=Williamsia sterculiae TaxID=1344003 RepID=A0A1N7DK90_9NOCA|nr:TetR/AcrR family transcriptional regulator [Williamsia sterculiae]SIR76165.1 transcriptional regulator, TetR family [Williamsia sterculiae]
MARDQTSESAGGGAATQRAYGGMPLDDRRELRREQFIEAGLQVFGTTGYAHSSVSQLCAAAGLSRRQFYEQFADREALLLAVYETIQRDAQASVAAGLARTRSTDLGELARVSMQEYMASVGTDPRRAEVSFVQIVGVSADAEQFRLTSRETWVDVFLVSAEQFGGRPPRDEFTDRYVAIGFIGALTAIVHRWSTAPAPRPDITAIVDTLTDLLVAFIRA